MNDRRASIAGGWGVITASGLRQLPSRDGAPRGGQKTTTSEVDVRHGEPPGMKMGTWPRSSKWIVPRHKAALKLRRVFNAE